MLNFIKENIFLFFIIFLLIVAPSLLFGAIQVVVYLVLGLFVLAIIGTLVLRWRVRKFAKENGFDSARYSNTTFNGAQNAQNAQNPNNGSDPTIRVKVFRTESAAGGAQSGASSASSASSATNKKVSPEVGDYVEFEEIKEEIKEEAKEE